MSIRNDSTTGAFVLDSALFTSLASLGWQPSADGRHWSLGDVGATLIHQSEDSSWHRFKFTSVLIQRPRLPSLLQRNALLAGPAKFVNGNRRPPFCRVDLPAFAPESSGATTCEVELGSALDPTKAWARALTDLATGALTSMVTPDTEAMLQEVRSTGRTASVDEGKLFVHLQLPGTFAQIRLDELDGGFKAVAEVVDLTNVPAESLQAMTALALEVNSRLPWVRVANAKGERSVLQAEVFMGSALIPGGWLNTAIELVEQAIVRSARELRALRDPTLARLTLAAAAAAAKKGGRQ